MTTRQQSMRPALAQPGLATSELDNDGLGETSVNAPASNDSSQWKAISALATEYTHAIRRSVADEDDVDRSGHVEQESPTWAEPQTSANSRDPQTYVSDAADWSPQPEAKRSAAVLAEVERVTAKVVPLNLETEVVVRFDFITNKESRVSEHTQSPVAC